MSLLNIFSNKRKAGNDFFNETEVFFGQYAGLNKTKEQLEHFEKAKSLYKEQRYLDAFEHFFLYLKNPLTENLAFDKDNSKISFRLIQGSKIISGFINEQEVLAEAEIVRFADTDNLLMLKLLHQNYHLKYCKFAIKNNIYSIKFFGITGDIQPESLYRALLEMAVYADSYDDILMLEFDQLQNMNINHIHHIAGEKVDFRLKYFKKLLGEILNTPLEHQSLNATYNTYLKMTNSLYTIDYLIAPGGKLQSKIRKLISAAEKSSEQDRAKVSETIKSSAEAVYETKEEEIKYDLQGIIRTFPEKEPATLDKIKTYIRKHLKEAHFFLDEGLSETSNLLLKHLVVSLPYKFGLMISQEKILLILWQYFHPAFFEEAGITLNFFNKAENRFNENKIKEYITNTIKNAKKKERTIVFNTGKINFASEISFIFSFLEEFAAIKYH